MVFDIFVVTAIVGIIIFLLRLYSNYHRRASKELRGKIYSG